MPPSMLIVHCSKAAFIMMIKHSQTTAKYLKASGRGTWQVTTSHTNSSTSVLRLSLLPPRHTPQLDGHRLSPNVTQAPNEKLSAHERRVAVHDSGCAAASTHTRAGTPHPLCGMWGLTATSCRPWVSEMHVLPLSLQLSSLPTVHLTFLSIQWLFFHSQP